MLYIVRRGTHKSCNRLLCREPGTIEAANVEQIRGVFGPPDMKEEDVKILQDALMKAANSPEFLENVEKTGATSTVLDAKQTGETFETFEKIIAPILEN